MPEMISPLAGIRAPGPADGTTAPASGDAALTLSDRAPPFILQVAGWADFETAIQPLIADFGFDSLGDYRIAQSRDGRHLLRLAPDRIWLVSDAPLTPAAELTPGDRLATLDVTHGRWIIDITGQALEDLLARLAPIDVRERHMPAGCFAQTAIHKTSVLIWRRASQHAQIFCPTSSVHALWSFITDTATPLGYRITK